MQKENQMPYGGVPCIVCGAPVFPSIEAPFALNNTHGNCAKKQAQAQAQTQALYEQTKSQSTPAGALVGIGATNASQVEDPTLYTVAGLLLEAYEGPGDQLRHPWRPFDVMLVARRIVRIVREEPGRNLR